MLYSTQDGKQLDEKLVENIQNDTENLMDTFSDMISSEHEEDFSKSLGKT